jgi:hypothetical protein
MAVGQSSAVGDLVLAIYDNYQNIQLHTADPGAAGTANIAGNATRKSVTWTSPAAGATGFRKIDNSGALSWSDAEVDTSEDYTHYSAWDDPSAGNFGHSGTITANAVNASGDAFEIAAGGLVVSTPIATT